jgi:hypothetical protein
LKGGQEAGQCKEKAMKKLAAVILGALVAGLISGCISIG